VGVGLPYSLACMTAQQTPTRPDSCHFCRLLSLLGEASFLVCPACALSFGWVRGGQRQVLVGALLRPLLDVEMYAVVGGVRPTPSSPSEAASSTKRHPSADSRSR